MRTIQAQTITQTVADLCAKANQQLPQDVTLRLAEMAEQEPWAPARAVLLELEQNLGCAKNKGLPICQDTGMACVYARLGQNVAIVGGDFEQAINQGVRLGYEENYLRKSIVKDPLHRENTRDNTPALITVSIVKGSNLQITVVPKGFGSENMSRSAMLKPSQGKQGVEDFVLETVKIAGPNPCPPIVVGVGIGGSFDKAALLSKQALLRPLTLPHPDPFYAEMEQNLLDSINQTGIGPAGYGGKTTALGVCIETFPTHIAGLPVAVTISCHATRRASALL